MESLQRFIESIPPEAFIGLAIKGDGGITHNSVIFGTSRRSSRPCFAHENGLAHVGGTREADPAAMSGRRHHRLDVHNVAETPSAVPPYTCLAADRIVTATSQAWPKKGVRVPFLLGKRTVTPFYDLGRKGPRENAYLNEICTLTIL